MMSANTSQYLAQIFKIAKTLNTRNIDITEDNFRTFSCNHFTLLKLLKFHKQGGNGRLDYFFVIINCSRGTF